MFNRFEKNQKKRKMRKIQFGQKSIPNGIQYRQPWQLIDFGNRVDGQAQTANSTTAPVENSQDLGKNAVAHDYDLMDLKETKVDVDDTGDRTIIATFNNNGHPYQVVQFPNWGKYGSTIEKGGNNGVLRIVENVPSENMNDTTYNGIKRGEPGYIQLQRRYNQGAIRRKQGGLISYLDYLQQGGASK